MKHVTVTKSIETPTRPAQPRQNRDLMAAAGGDPLTAFILLLAKKKASEHNSQDSSPETTD